MYGGSAYNPNPSSYTGTGGPVSPSHVMRPEVLSFSPMHPDLSSLLLSLWSAVSSHTPREISSISTLLYLQFVQSGAVILDFHLRNHLQYKARIFGAKVLHNPRRHWNDPGGVLRAERQSAVCVRFWLSCDAERTAMCESSERCDSSRTR